MKKVCACLLLMLVAVVWGMQSASAIQPFSKEWTAKYNAGDKNAAFTEAKCNVCHAGESKKMRNEYGKAVGKYLSKKAYSDVKEDEAAAKKYIEEGLSKVEGEKSSSGKTYGELIKAGKLPGGA
jgi:hypothetical protein